MIAHQISIVLKEVSLSRGGTAINLFFLEIPRLSVDIDINYIGSPTREELDRDRNAFENIIESVCHEESCP